MQTYLSIWGMSNATRSMSSYLLTAALPHLGTPLLDPRRDLDFMRLALVEERCQLEQAIPPNDDLRFETHVTDAEKLEVGSLFSVIVEVKNQDGAPVGRVVQQYLKRSLQARTKAVEDWLLSRAYVSTAPIAFTQNFHLDKAQLEQYALLSQDRSPIYVNDDFARMNGFASSVLAPHFLQGLVEVGFLQGLGDQNVWVRQLDGQIGALAYADRALEAQYQKEKGSDVYIATLRQDNELMLTARLILSSTNS